MKLRPYQEEDLKKLCKYKKSACFNEQRTGKTPIALMTLKARNLLDHKTLIVTTASALYQWADECKAWLKINPIVCAGTKQQKLKAVKEWETILIISLDSLKDTKTSAYLLKEIIKEDIACVILDEAHKIKNSVTAAAKSMYKFRKVPYRLALTGTPAPGKPYDVHGILKFLYPKQFNSIWRFKEEYFNKEEHTILRYGKLQKYTEYTTFKREKRTAFQALLNEISTQRKRKEVMPWLPNKDYIRINLPCTKLQQKYITDLHEKMAIEDIEVTGTLDTLIRERQICLDPAIIELKESSPKTDYIKQYLKDYENEPVIIFSKFTTYLTKLYNDLKNHHKIGMIVGATPAKTRAKLKKDFQEGKFNILLLNIDAGKEALTLDRAETAIFTDKFPPIGDIQQAEDRFIATTEKKKEKPHRIIELVMKDTFDERIHTLLARRASETAVINDYKRFIKEKKDA